MKKILCNIVKTGSVLGLLLMGLIFLPEGNAYAASKVTVNTVDYEDETLIVNNNGNSKIFFATETEAAKDRWEVMDADAGLTTEIDFSWVSPTSEGIIKIKGDQVDTQTRVIFPEKTRKLEVSINYASMPQLNKTDSIAPLLNIMSTAGTADQPITINDLEWKKNDTGKWKDISELTVAQLEKYQIKGADLYFRIKAVNDLTVGGISPDGSLGRRVSNEVKLKIAKKAAAMVVGIDGEEFTAEIKYGKEYRVTVGATTTDWIRITDRSVKKLPLEMIVNDGSDGMTDPFPQMFIEIRDYSTAKAAASKITEIELDAQRIITGSVIEGKAPSGATSADKNIYLYYNGNKNMEITVPSASIDNPYEYCVVKPGDVFDLERAVWSTLTKNTAVKILASKAVEGGTLYVRQKEIKSRAATKTTPAVAYALASTYVTHDISYPSIPEFTKASYTFIKKYSNSITFDVKLNVTGKKPFETGISNVKLGTRDIDFSYTVTPGIPDPINTATEYVMTVTLDKTSLESMTNCYNRAISIYFGNGTVDKTSIKLTIKNATPAYSLTASAAQGTATGTTAITVVTSPADGNIFIYTITPAEIEDKNIEDTVPAGPTVFAFTSGNDISIATPNSYVTVYEINSATRNIVRYRSILITSSYIK